MDRDQEHEKQEGSKPTADAKLQDGEDSGDFNTVTLNDESLDETQYQGEKKLIEGTPDAASKNDREGMCDGVNPVTTKETANTSGESQSGGGALLKKDKNTVDTASKEEKESVSGIESVTGDSSTQSEKSTDETQSKRGSLPNDSNSLKTGEPAEDTTSNIEREKKSGEGNTGTPSKDKRISPSDVGNSAISKPNLPKASPDAAKHSDMDRPVVSYNQKRLTNDDKEEDKRQEETVEDKLRQSLENNEQLLKRCNDIQKEYENVKKDYAEMERKFESISKEKEDLLVTNNTVTKERDETIQAYKELGGKDIDNQGTILELKTNVSDIQKRYNDMENCKSKVENQLTEEQKSWRQEKCRHKNEIEKANKAYNEVTKQLKEERKSWTQEKSNLQKKHDDESKKDKKEIDKANKAIGSLNQKVADKEEELKKKKNFMEKLIREKKEVDEKNTMHEKNIAILQENIKKLTEQKIKDEREHNKKVKDLTREINAERDNFSGLSYQYNELVKQIQSLQEENRSLTREKQELLLRLSKVAGANLTYNNPNIADLSDEKRPTKLAEEFSELYDNEWTDAFEDLQFENEKEKTTFMLGLVMTASQLCSDVSSDHGQKIKDSLCTLVLPCKPSKCSKECTDDDIIPATIAPLEETNNSTPKQVGNVEDKEIEDSKHKAGNLPCTSENTSGSGKTKAYVQETTENTENKKGKTADDTKQSPSIKDRENKDEETTDDTNQSPSKKKQETTENTEGTTADDTKQSPSNKEGENERVKKKKTADDADNPSTESEQDTTGNTENNEGETAGITDTRRPPSVSEGDNKRDKEETTADDANNPSTESEQDTTKNTENNEGETAGITDNRRHPSINERDDKGNEEKETADDTNNPPPGNERGNTENKMEEATDDANKPPSVNEGDNKRDKVEKPADDANKPPSESEQDTTENTENNEGETAGITDTRRPPSEQEDVITNGEEDDSSYSNNNEGDNNRDQEENAADDANNLSVLNERGNTENTEHRNEETTDDTCKPPSESEQDTIENTENNEGETAGITDTRRPPWKQGDAVTNSANVSDTPEAKKQEDAAAHGTNDDTPEAKKQENAVTHGVNHDTPEAKEIRHVSNFDELFQKEQKKTIMDAKKLVEKHLSEEIEKTGTDLIVQEHGIDMEKQKSVVEYIKKCVNICWSMHRNEPPVFVEFPDNTEDIKFDTNKFKPYTKSGTYIDYIVWPAVYLHEGGPLLCKGVAQGRK